MLSAAKHLAQWAPRCFAALSMTGLVLLVKTHHRHVVTQPCDLQDSSLLRRILIGLLTRPLQAASLFLSELLGVCSFFNLLLQYRDMPANLYDIANAYRVHS